MAFLGSEIIVKKYIYIAVFMLLCVKYSEQFTQNITSSCSLTKKCGQKQEKDTEVVDFEGIQCK